MAKLILRDGANGKEFDLEKSGSLTVGRSPDCDITIEDTQASRRHCSVVKLQSGYEVNDLGSTNGTLVNSTLVKRQKLKHGDVIRIGAVEIGFDDPSSAGVAAEPSVGYLVYAKGDKKGQKVELSAQRTTIGRKPTNTLVVEDPVCSSYHCEIVRGLNGYTIRDLGSTNGTLVNSEMVTESSLSHGARIRIGNVRFVFEDPALAAIDLELAGADDEDEWGMMRDIDLAAVRKRNPATIVYAVLFVAIVGAGGYFLTAKRKETKGGPEGPPNNLIEDFSFETETASALWRGEPDTGVQIGLSKQGHGQGKQALEIRSGIPSAEAFYETRFQGDRARYRLKGVVSARGAKASVGVLWSGGTGLQRWTTAPAIESSSPAPVDLVLDAPPWASSALLGVRIAGEGSVFLDDVSLVREGAAAFAEVKSDESNQFRVDITDGRWVDMFHIAAPILVNGHAFVRDAEGKDVDTPGLRLKAEAQDKEHILVTVEGAGNAPMAGIVLEEVSGYLSRGGFRAFTPTPKPKPGEKEGKTFQPSFPEEGVLTLEAVRKLLLGPSGRSFAALPATDDGRLDAVARVDGKTRTVALFGPVSDGRFSFRFKVDLSGEARLATNSIADALALHAAPRWGEFLDAAKQVLAEFPFANPASRADLNDKITQVNQDYENRCSRIDQHLKEYKAFKDRQDLDAAAAELAELERIHQIKPDDTTRGQYLKAAKEEVARLDLAAREQRETALAAPIFALATYVNLKKNPPDICSAVYQLFFVAEFLPAAKDAPKARAELQRLAQQYPAAKQALAVLEKFKPR